MVGVMTSKLFRFGVKVRSPLILTGKNVSYILKIRAFAHLIFISYVAFPPLLLSFWLFDESS